MVFAAASDPARLRFRVLAVSVKALLGLRPATRKQKMTDA